MSERRQVWETILRLLQKVEKSMDAASQPLAGVDLSGLEQEIRKLGKTQFKANVLAEEQASRVDKALAATLAVQEQDAQIAEKLEEKHSAAVLKDLLEAILPALDGIDNALASGKGYLQKRDLAARKTDLTPAQAVLVSPADRAMLSGWLDGLVLVRERMLAILERGGVTTIPTVGHRFDPYLHMAVGTAAQVPAGMEIAPNLIVAEERRGYRTSAGVIRFAEVIVYHPK